MKIYVAGPMTVGNRIANIRKAVDVAASLMSLGHEVYVPHLNDFFDFIHRQTEQTWIRQNMAWLDACDAVFRIEGFSVGADAEVERATRDLKPVYHSLTHVPFAKSNAV